MAKQKPETFDMRKVIQTSGLRIGTYHFACPYCRKEWPRGGKKEGFVKSGASNHVSACRDIVLYEAGYVLVSGDWVTVMRVADALATYDWVKRNVKLIKASIGSRRRAGLTPRALYAAPHLEGTR